MVLEVAGGDEFILFFYLFFIFGRCCLVDGGIVTVVMRAS